jgi:hypothetical protein
MNLPDASYSSADVYIDGSKDNPKNMFVVLGHKTKPFIFKKSIMNRDHQRVFNNGLQMEITQQILEIQL